MEESQPQGLRASLTVGEQHWAWKLGFRIALLVLDIIGIGCVGYATAASVNLSTWWIDSWAIPWGLITVRCWDLLLSTLHNLQSLNTSLFIFDMNILTCSSSPSPSSGASSASSCCSRENAPSTLAPSSASTSSSGSASSSPPSSPSPASSASSPLATQATSATTPVPREATISHPTTHGFGTPPARTTILPRRAIAGAAATMDSHPAPSKTTWSTGCGRKGAPSWRRRRQAWRCSSWACWAILSC